MMALSDSLKAGKRGPGKVGGTSGAESENAHVFFSRVTHMRTLFVFQQSTAREPGQAVIELSK